MNLGLFSMSAEFENKTFENSTIRKFRTIQKTRLLIWGRLEGFRTFDWLKLREMSKISILINPNR